MPQLPLKAYGCETFQIIGGTLATPRLSLAQGKKVYEEGKLLQDNAEYISTLGTSENKKRYNLPAGTYQFEIK